MKSELEEAEEWVDKEYPWLRKSVRAGEWNTLSTVAFEKAHLAGQKVGEKRGYENVMKEIQRLISIGHAEVGVMQNLYGWLSNKLKEGA